MAELGSVRPAESIGLAIDEAAAALSADAIEIEEVRSLPLALCQGTSRRSRTGGPSPPL